VHPVAEVWNGWRWNRTSLPSAGRGLEVSLDGLSCPTARACVAVGARVTATATATSPIAYRFDGRRWVRMPVPAPAQPLSQLSAVSCPRAGDCLAGGAALASLRLTGPPPRTVGERLSAGRWASVRIPRPAGSAGATLDAISCRTSDDCLAAGDVRRARHTVIVRPLVEHWDGDHWASLPFPSPARSAAVAAVACPSLGDCLAVTDAPGAGAELSFIAAVP
jgi:hypothetical protein